MTYIRKFTTEESDGAKLIYYLEFFVFDWDCHNSHLDLDYIPNPELHRVGFGKAVRY